MAIVVEKFSRGFYGGRLDANRECMQRPMRVMGIEAIYPKPKLSQRNEEHGFIPIYCGISPLFGPTRCGQRHHLRADAARLDVLDGGDGLAPPFRVVVAIVEHD
jgi:hypothetical protein